MFVYFIQAGDSGPIKIGIAFDPDERLKHLQTGHYETLHLRAACPGGPELEAELHERFRAGHLRGEWFRPDLLGLVEAMAAAAAIPPTTAYAARKEYEQKRERVETRAVDAALNGSWEEAQQLIAKVPPKPSGFKL